MEDGSFQLLDISTFVARNGFILKSISVLLMAETFCCVSYLIASMGLQVLWSFGLMCLDIHALRFNKDLHTNIIVSLFVVGDWVSEALLRFINLNCLLSFVTSFAIYAPFIYVNLHESAELTHAEVN